MINFSSPPEQRHIEMLMDPVRAVCILPGLWHCFGWASAKDVLNGAGLQENVGWGCEEPVGLCQSVVGRGL